MHLKNTAATTDVTAFIQDIEGGRFDQMFSLAVSQTAASVAGQDKKGKVVLTFDIEGIPGASQVRINHKVEFKRPTDRGNIIENDESSTIFFVGKAGALSLAQPSLLDRQGELSGLGK